MVHVSREGEYFAPVQIKNPTLARGARMGHPGKPKTVKHGSKRPAEQSGWGILRNRIRYLTRRNFPLGRSMSEKYDVIVVGGGNAALCAALSAREAGARVLVLERSPENERGGNTRHTRNIRCTHAAADQFFSGAYSEEEHLQDLI